MRWLAVSKGGPLIAVGPVHDVDRHEAADVGIVGCLSAMGIIQTEARRVDRRLHHGEILIGVHSDDY